MIYIYNETNTPWDYNRLTEKVSKFVIKKPVSDNKEKRIDLVVSNNITVNEHLSSYVNMNSVMQISESSTGVIFQKKDCVPLVTADSKYTKNIILLNINLRGRIIRDILTRGVQILTYAIAKGELIMAVSCSDAQDTAMDIIMYSSKTETDTQYSFVKTKTGYGINITENDDVEAIESPVYKIKKYRPTSPTHLVLVHKDDMNAMTANNVIMKPERYCIVEFDENDIAEIIAKYRQDGYRAATLYVNTEFLNRDTEFGVYYETIRNSFTYLNIIINNGKVFKR